MELFVALSFYPSRAMAMLLEKASCMSFRKLIYGFKSICVSNTSEVSADLDTSKDGASNEVTESENKAVAAGGVSSAELADFEGEQFHSKPRSLMW